MVDNTGNGVSLQKLPDKSQEKDKVNIIVGN